MGTQQHTVLIVKCTNNDEIDDEERMARAAHAAATFELAKAWFDYGPDGNDPTVPMIYPDGTFKVHAPSINTLTYLKEYLIPHEGMIVVDVTSEDGHGIHPMDVIDAILSAPAD